MLTANYYFQYSKARNCYQHRDCDLLVEPSSAWAQPIASQAETLITKILKLENLRIF
jgi:hypothetical protein